MLFKLPTNPNNDCRVLCCLHWYPEYIPALFWAWKKCYLSIHVMESGDHQDTGEFCLDTQIQNQPICTASVCDEHAKSQQSIVSDNSLTGSTASAFDRSNENCALLSVRCHLVARGYRLTWEWAGKSSWDPKIQPYSTVNTCGAFKRVMKLILRWSVHNYPNKVNQICAGN